MQCQPPYGWQGPLGPDVSTCCCVCQCGDSPASTLATLPRACRSLMEQSLQYYPSLYNQSPYEKNGAWVFLLTVHMVCVREVPHGSKRHGRGFIEQRHQLVSLACLILHDFSTWTHSLGVTWCTSGLHCCRIGIYIHSPSFARIV